LTHGRFTELSIRRLERIKQFHLLLGVIAVILWALLCSVYILDLVRLADLQTDTCAISLAFGCVPPAGVLVTLLMKAAPKKWSAHFMGLSGG
jgi:hypothetical protein